MLIRSSLLLFTYMFLQGEVIKSKDSYLTKEGLQVESGFCLTVKGTVAHEGELLVAFEEIPYKVFPLSSNMQRVNELSEEEIINWKHE